MNAPYKSPDPNLSPPYGIVVTINGLSFASEGLKAVVRNNYYDYIREDVSDQFWMGSAEGKTLFPVKMRDEGISWSLTDYSAAVLSNNDVLPARFDVSAWWGENLLLISASVGDREGPAYRILGIVDGSGGAGSGFTSGGDSGGGGGCFISTAGQGS